MDSYNKRSGIVRTGISGAWIYFEGEEQKEWNPASGQPMPLTLRKQFEKSSEPYSVGVVRMGSSAKWVETVKQ